MVSLEQRQALASLAEVDQHLKKFQMLLNGQYPRGPGKDSGDVRELLLEAICSNNSAGFKEAASKISERKITADSDWCNDDYLLFLLLLGNEKYGRPLSFLKNVIEARGKNPNPIPRKINDVFAALERQEFGMDGEYCFLKIPFLYLAGKLRLDSAAAQKALSALTAPHFFDHFSPFLKLLTQKAHDLVLTDRQPLPTETTAQLMEGFENHAKNLSLRQWWRVIVVLPGRIHLAIIGLILSLGLIPILFGFGKGLAETWKSDQHRVRPTKMTVAEAHEVNSSLPSEAITLAKSLAPQDAPGQNKYASIVVETEPILNATPAFVVEISHPTKAISNAFAFVQVAGENSRSFTIVPIERDSGRFRAILPEQAKGTKICFVFSVEIEPGETIDTVAKSTILRPIQ